MSATSPSDADGTAFPFPVQVVHDRSDDRLEAVVDVLPAAVDDLTVEVSSSQLKLTVEHNDDRAEQTVTPPDRHAFGDDRTAAYNNGVLSVTLETVSRVRARY